MFEPDRDVIRWGLDALFVNPSKETDNPCISTCLERDRIEGFVSCSDRDVSSYFGQNGDCSQAELLELEDDLSDLDGQVGEWLHQISIPHVPKVNGEIPTTDEATSDQQRLIGRLNEYGLVELTVEGDGNCQFRALADQIYRSVDHHSFVRKQVVYQLKYHSENYRAHVPMAYKDYLKRLSKDGEWGDHVTLQAAADLYGVKIFVLTSFKDTCCIEIQPIVLKSNRVIFLSFWAEVHYNSIYPEGEYPILETVEKKTRRFWSQHFHLQRFS